MHTRKIAAGVGAAAVLTAGILTACGHHDHCLDDGVVCDDHGAELVYAPYIIPAVGIYGQPGYHSQIIIQPGAPGYHTTYINHAPDYRPSRTPAPPAANPSNTKPSSSVKATASKPPATQSNKAPSTAKAPTVKAPSVKAPSVKAPSVKTGK